jgi:LPS sulfotransferase NodH
MFSLKRYAPFIAKVKREVTFLSGKLFGWKKHKRLVIVTRSRSGSNMLCSYLESHPDCFMWREVFRRPQYFNPSLTKFLVHGKYLRKFKLVGYKVFYYHTVPEYYWNEIISDDDIRIIHLVRKNHLRTFISQREATKSTQWETFKDNHKQPSREKLNVDVEDLISFLKKNETMISNMNTRLASRKNVLQLSYEELIDGMGREQVKDFLADVLNPDGYGTPENKKQSVGKLSDRITNSAEVEAILSKFNYSQFTTKE